MTEELAGAPGSQDPSGQEGQQQEPGKAPDLFTLEQVQKIVDDRIGQARQQWQTDLNNTFRGVQSQTDRVGNKIAESLSSLDGFFTLAQNFGVELDPQVRAAMQQAQLVEGFRAPSNPTPGQGQGASQPTATPPPNNQQPPPSQLDPTSIDTVVSEAERILREEGNGLTYEALDPEAKGILDAAGATNDANKFYAAARTAIKVHNLNKPQPPPQAPAQGGDGAAPPQPTPPAPRNVNPIMSSGAPSQSNPVLEDFSENLDRTWDEVTKAGAPTLPPRGQ